jgi:hypothetical protein
MMAMPMRVAAWIALLTSFACGADRRQDGAMTTPARPTPWAIEYADGAANLYRFARRSTDEPVAFVYDPVKPAQSSTGFYDGGEPVDTSIPADDPRVEELWGAAERLAADGALHVEDRMKGTGAFALTTDGRTREFIVRQGAELAAFHAIAAGFRPAR